MASATRFERISLFLVYELIAVFADQVILSNRKELHQLIEQSCPMLTIFLVWKTHVKQNPAG